jgi:hypothetical protein
MNKTIDLRKTNTKSFPDQEGNWLLVETGETVKAIETEDVQGFPMVIVEIEGGRFFDTDLKGTFVKLDEK